MRAKEFITEYRNRMYQYIKSIVPGFPDYIVKDWLYANFARGATQGPNWSFDTIGKDIPNILKDMGLSVDTQWQLVPNMKFTMGMWEPKTLKRLQERAGGSSKSTDPNVHIPARDAERHATQAALAKQQGGVRKEPVILIKTPQGYELLEGWHRTIQHFHMYPDGYTGPAYVAVAQGQQGVAEGEIGRKIGSTIGGVFGDKAAKIGGGLGDKTGDFLDKLNPFSKDSAIFLNPNTVIVGQQHGQPLKLSPNTLKQIQAIAAKHGAWYEGNGTDRGYTKGQIDRYVGSWDDEVAKTANSNDPKWIYVLFANVDENNRVQRVGIDPNDTIFNRLLTTAQDNSYQGIGYTSQALQKFLQMASEGKYDFLKMSQQPATQENLTRFLKAGEALMWPRNWKQYPNKAGKIAKAATVDVRDQYLATRKAGVYVAGRGHLKAVQNITGKQGLTEGTLSVDVPNEDWLQEKIDYAKSKGRNSYGVPYMGSTTASVRGTPPRVRVMRLASLPGMRNEQTNIRKNDLKWLMDYMEKTGKLPPMSSSPDHEYLPYIAVAYNGEAWVNEGNHRIMAAYRLNWQDMPIEIRYFDGGERIKTGPMAPEKIGLA
jgi:phage gp37-like protein